MCYAVIKVGYKKDGIFHRALPLPRRRLRELDVGFWAPLCPRLVGIIFSSRLGEVSRDWRGGLLDDVRGSRLFPALLGPLAMGMALPPFPSRLPGLNGFVPPLPVRWRMSRSIIYAWGWEERLLVGVGGMDWLLRRLGGVVEELDLLPGLRLLALIPNRSLDSHALMSSPAMFRTSTAPSTSASRSIASIKPYLLMTAPWSSLASQILRIMRSRFSRTTALLELSFCRMRENRSGRARLSATGGLSRRSFCRGSRRFSNAFAFEVVKHLRMP